MAGRCIYCTRLGGTPPPPPGRWSTFAEPTSSGRQVRRLQHVHASVVYIVYSYHCMYPHTRPSHSMAEKTPELPPIADDDSSLMGLTHVEPSPVDETPVEFKQDYFTPTTADSAAPSLSPSTTLGLGNHGPAYYRMSLQHRRSAPRPPRLTRAQSPASSATPRTPSPSSLPSTWQTRP